MKKELAKVPANALEALAARLKVSPKGLEETLMATAFSACKGNKEAFIAAVIVANTYQLNPILKEMTVFESRGGVIPIVMIDGWIHLVNRQPNFNGCELNENEGENDGGSGTKIESVTAKFYLKDRQHPVVITEYMAECYNGNKEPWKKWPRRMLRHKAYIQGARVAFGFSGIYDPDEAERIAEVVDVEVTDPVAKSEADKPAPEKGQPEKENGKPSAYKTMLLEFEKQKKRIGADAYYVILGGEGYEHANQIESVEKGKAIWKLMAAAKVVE